MKSSGRPTEFLALRVGGYVFLQNVSRPGQLIRVAARYRCINALPQAEFLVRRCGFRPAASVVGQAMNLTVAALADQN
jgi:hypothetical protein